MNTIGDDVLFLNGGAVKSLCWTTLKPGSHLLYNDGRPGHTEAKATVLSVCKAGMVVQFEDRADVTRILFSDYGWMKFLTVTTNN